MNLHIDPRMYTNQTSRLENGAQPKDDHRLKETCAEFEAVMVQTMFKAMRGSETEDGLIEKDTASEVYRDFFDAEVASQLAHNQSMGLGQMIYQQLQTKDIKA
ncbi:MAG: rod-binding protein [Thermodesulfobacteriota bacterium]|nr:rod-binding protein [Thermodesulfobacteriota bacterium]